MRLPLNWLFEYADPHTTPRAIADRLAMTGTEVDRIHRHGVDALEFFVVGKVLTCEQHPNADRLRVTARSTSAPASRRTSSAARPTWPRARPSPSPGRARSCPTARA